MKLHIADDRPTLIHSREDPAPAVSTTLSFPVDGIDEAVDALIGDGVEFECFEGPTRTTRA